MPAAARSFDWVTRLVRLHRAGLVGVARSEGLAAEDAIDCVQEAFCTFLRVPQAPSLADAPADAARLLTVIARNVARNRRRRHDRALPHVTDEAALERLLEPGPATDALLAQAEDHLRLRGCVSQLGDLQRRVVTLRLLEELPGEDVAALLGLTPGHVAVLLHRAKLSLRHCMECGA
jgi:RNA polymerase sigma-70 factor (ECF subfamily)